MFGGLLETLGQPADYVFVVVQQRMQHWNMTKVNNRKATL